MNLTKAFLFSAAIVLACSAIVQAETIGYWRFEDTPGLLQDSSTYDNDLTKVGNPVHYTLPSSGAGSKFHDPIPQNSLANAKAVNLDGVGDYYACGDQDEFAVGDFTIEAYVNLDTDSADGGQFIASQWGGSLGRTWRLGAAGSGGRELQLGVDASNGTQYINSGYDLVLDHDYFVAASFDISKSGVGEGGVKFYYQDLTAGGSLQTVTVDHTRTGTSLTGATCDFTIGLLDLYTSMYEWDGLIDEVRLSNKVLGETELLAVPEPSTIVLLGSSLLGLLLLLLRRRRK